MAACDAEAARLALSRRCWRLDNYGFEYRQRPAGLDPATGVRRCPRCSPSPIETPEFRRCKAFSRGYSQRKRSYRFWGETMAQRISAGWLLIAWLLLDLTILVFTQTAGARLNSGHIGQQVAWTAIDVFLVWRVWRGGRIAWGLLLALDVIPLAMMVAGHVGPWGAYDDGLFLFALAQTLILLTPAVRHHVSRS
jgi:hypothetical protein